MARRLTRGAVVTVAVSTCALGGCTLGLFSVASQRAEPVSSAPAPLHLAPAFDLGDKAAEQSPLTVSDEASAITLRRSEAYAFAETGDPAFQRAYSAALSGDRNAALRVARIFEHGSNGVARDERRMLLWLRRASDLQNGAASYRLYLYYLDRGLDREAVRYEKRAVEQGYILPARLDSRRG